MSKVAAHAEKRTTNLGLSDNKVHWMGTSEMHWNQLLPTLHLKMMFNTPPTVLLIHLGGNDLVDIKQAKLMKSMRKDLKYIGSVFPNAYLVWSDILPRRHWRDMDFTPKNLSNINERCKRIKLIVLSIGKELWSGSIYIIHEMETLTPGLFKQDQTLLSFTCPFLNPTYI